MAPPGIGQRILIGAGCFADAEAAFRLVERFERQLQFELGGLLVDEGFITEAARSPMQRVVTPGGNLVDPPTAQKARALLASDARAFQRLLSATAQARSVKWSFEKRSGDLVRHVFEAAKEWDILLLGRRTLHKRSGQIVIVSGHANRSERAELVAASLADAAETDHVTLSLSPKLSKDDAEDALFVAEPDASGLLTRLNRMNAAAVVVDLEASQWRSSELMRQLLEAARCPLVVLRPEHANDRRDTSAGIPEAPNPRNDRLEKE